MSVESWGFLYPSVDSRGMDEGLRVRERLGVADVITLFNAVVGLAAAVVALSAPTLAARLILLAAIFDAIDGLVARQFGGTAVGPLLDSVADVVSFGATPALFIYGVAAAEWGWLADGPLAAPPLEAAVALGAGSLFVLMSILRTALYSEFVGPAENRPGIQNTLAATIVVTAYLAGLTTVPALLLLSGALSLAMVAPVAYPKLLARDASVLGVVQAGAILAPVAYARVFPRVLLVAALAYMTLAPRYYWAE
jgi:archaetidylserine synthase